MLKEQTEPPGSVMYEEDIRVLPKQYHAIYNDTPDSLNFSETIAQHVVDQIQELRRIFILTFDDFAFHQCFHFVSKPDFGKFKLHQKFFRAE